MLANVVYTRYTVQCFRHLKSLLCNIFLRYRWMVIQCWITRMWIYSKLKHFDIMLTTLSFGRSRHVPTRISSTSKMPSYTCSQHRLWRPFTPSLAFCCHRPSPSSNRATVSCRYVSVTYYHYLIIIYNLMEQYVTASLLLFCLCQVMSTSVKYHGKLHLFHHGSRNICPYVLIYYISLSEVFVS